MLTMDYMDFQCSFRGCRKEFYEILLMSAFVAVLVVVVKNLINFIPVLALIVKNYIDFCLYQLLIMWTSIEVFGGFVKTYIGFYLCVLSL